MMKESDVEYRRQRKDDAIFVHFLDAVIDI